MCQVEANNPSPSAKLNILKLATIIYILCMKFLGLSYRISCRRDLVIVSSLNVFQGFKQIGLLVTITAAL